MSLYCIGIQLVHHWYILCWCSPWFGLSIIDWKFNCGFHAQTYICKPITNEIQRFWKSCRHMTNYNNLVLTLPYVVLVKKDASDTLICIRSFMNPFRSSRRLTLWHWMYVPMSKKNMTVINISIRTLKWISISKGFF